MQNLFQMNFLSSSWVQQKDLAAYKNCKTYKFSKLPDQRSTKAQLAAAKKQQRVEAKQFQLQILQSCSGYSYSWSSRHALIY